MTQPDPNTGLTGPLGGAIPGRRSSTAWSAMLRQFFQTVPKELSQARADRLKLRRVRH